MDPFEIADEETQKKVVETWKGMDETDKGHFINQVALALSIWGSDTSGRKMVLGVLSHMARNDCRTLADFGLYIEQALIEDAAQKQRGKIERAAVIIEGYRIKNALSSVPHKEIGL